ncbi:MAG TPA: ABC transporter permease [Candidatus Acidoferrales bacterium]|nr:ABC transporter permease [Candidatus Acidoferrales bacterium]
MRRLTKLSLRFRSLFRRHDADHELDSELRFHLDRQIAANIAAGMSPAEARRQAMLEFGGVEELKEECRDMRRINWLQDFVQDLRFGLRMLRKSPGFTTVAVLTLALGIGATTSIFSVIKATILNPLPFRQPEKLVYVWEGAPGERYHQGDQSYFSSVRTGNLYAWRSQSQSLESVSAYRWQSMLLTGEKQAEEVTAQDVADQFFETLGRPAQLGRTFQPADYGPGSPNVTVLSHRMWVEKFDQDHGIIGRRVLLNHVPHEVVGVMPAGFFPTEWGYADLWTPHWASEKEKQDFTSWGWSVVARLRHSITWEQAQTELDVVSARLAKENPLDRNTGAVVVPMDSQLIGSSWKLLLLLFGGVLLLLLIAFVNVANLLLARAVGREKEFSIRAALGARRSRLIAQLFTESLLLAIAASTAGVAVATGGTRALLALLPQSVSLPRLDSAKVDFGVLPLVCGIAVLATLFFSLIPLLHLSQKRAADSLKYEGRGSTFGKSKRRLGQAFVVSEFVFSLVLLILGGLLMDRFLKLERVTPGFEPKNLLAFQINVPQITYGKIVQGGDNARREQLYKQLEQRLATIPGIQSVAFTEKLPLRHEYNPWSFRIEGHQPGNVDAAASGTPGFGGEGEASFQRVSPSFLETLKLKLVGGRFLEERDNASAPMVTVVDEAFVRKFLPHENPIGKRVTVDGTSWFPQATIIGVIADFKLNSLDRNPYPALFWCLRQVPDEHEDVWIVARTAADPRTVSTDLRRTIQSFDPEIPITEVESMTGVISDSLWRNRISADLIGLLAVLAIMLAGTGIYSIMSYSVSQRRREIGIRLALGANPRDVLRLILGETCRLALLGSILGCAAASAAGRLAMNQVYLAPSLASSQNQITSLHPAAFILSSLFLFAMAVCASYFPARHAMNVDPMIALRYE